MRKRDLIREVGKSTGLTQIFVRYVLDGILDAICNSLARGERVELRNFGIFTTRKKRGRFIKIPGTGKKVRIRPATVVRFKPGKKLKKKAA